MEPAPTETPALTPTPEPAATPPPTQPFVPGVSEQRSEKSFIVVWVLSILVGMFAVDRFYLGKIGTGILKLITFGGIGIWYFVDLIILLCDGTRDKQGNKLADYEKNKVLAIILTVVIVAAGSIGASRSSTTWTVTPSPDVQTTTQPAEDTPKSDAKWDVEAAYAKIENGMTKAQVEDATGKKSDNCSESQIEGYGKTESCSYGSAFTDKASILVIYTQDKVSSKSKSTY
jgi:TM2 domain-containing membrane protein YozV